METQMAAPAARDYSRRFSREVKPRVLDAMLFGLFPAVGIPTFAYLVFPKPQEMKSLLASAFVIYALTIVVFVFVQAVRIGTALVKERSAELQELRTFKAQVTAEPLYIGPQEYCFRIDGNNVSLSFRVVRHAPVSIVHLHVDVRGNNRDVFARDFTDPMRIKNTSQIILNNLLLQPEEVQGLTAELFQIVGSATLENGTFYNFQFLSVPLRT